MSTDALICSKPTGGYGNTFYNNIEMSCFLKQEDQQLSTKDAYTSRFVSNVSVILIFKAFPSCNEVIERFLGFYRLFKLIMQTFFMENNKLLNLALYLT